MKNIKTRHLITGTLFAAIAAHPLAAQNAIWTGDGDGSSWNDADNWDNDAVPTNAYSLTGMTGANIVIGNGVAAELNKAENGGITGGTLTVETGGSLTTIGTLEVNRKDGEGSLLDINGGSVTVGTTTYISHYQDATTPESPTVGTLKVRNGGSFTTNYFRNDGGETSLIIDGSGSSVSAISGNNTFANSDTATTHLQISNGGTLTTSGRDFWGGAGSTLSISGGTYSNAGDQFYFQSRYQGTQEVSISGGKITTAGTLYAASGSLQIRDEFNAVIDTLFDGGETTIDHTSGELEMTNASKDFNFSNSANSIVTYNIGGDAVLDLSRNLNMNRSDSQNTLTITGENVVFEIDGQISANSATTTIGFIFSEGGVTALAAEGNISITGAALFLDLSGYDDANGDVLLLNSNTGGISGTFASADFGGTGTGTLDYSTSGELWLRGITAIPEPGTFALLAGITGLACVALRRRR